MTCKVPACDNPVFDDELCMEHFRAFALTKAQDVLSILNNNQEIRLKSSNIKARCVLENAQKHLEDRAVTYDSAQGERSIGKTVEMFNTLTGHKLTEAEGWFFMAILKMVRANQGEFKADNYEDGAAYFALACESAAQKK